jgi:hypothetical protein
MSPPSAAAAVVVVAVLLRDPHEFMNVYATHVGFHSMRESFHGFARERLMVHIGFVFVFVFVLVFTADSIVGCIATAIIIASIITSIIAIAIAILSNIIIVCEKAKDLSGRKL